MARPPKGPCGKLFHQGRSGNLVDICRLPAGHEGDHMGRQKGVHWRDSEHSETGREITGWDEIRPLG